MKSFKLMINFVLCASALVLSGCSLTTMRSSRQLDKG